MNEFEYLRDSKNTINWKSYKEKPENGTEVWVLLHHWKKHFPSSFEIKAGEVEYGQGGVWRVNTCDYSGCGNYSFYPNNGYNSSHEELFNFWCDKWEIPVPFEMIRND